MAFEVDEDILQDFLVEASEILEQLSEQLVDLEKRPDDKNLLNAIFRGFHTVKGGQVFCRSVNWLMYATVRKTCSISCVMASEPLLRS